METAVKRLYEGLFLVDSGLAAAGWQQVNDLIEKVLHRAEADIVSLRKWDERKLAYPVEGSGRGTYLLTYFHCQPGRVPDIERDVQLSEQILRVLILRTDRMNQSLMDKPTPAMLIAGPATESAPAEAQPESLTENAPAEAQPESKNLPEEELEKEKSAAECEPSATD